MKWQTYWQMFSPPWYCLLLIKNGNYTLIILADEMADLLADLGLPYYLLVIKNGNYTFLLL